MLYQRLLVFTLFFFVCSFMGCSRFRPMTSIDANTVLRSCSLLPNCVSSSSKNPLSKSSPFELAVPADEAWRAVKEAVAGLPNTKIVDERPNYLHAKCRSAVFRFVDHLELLLHPEKGTISVRSAAVLGISDLGVNRLRIRKLRTILSEQGIIK